MKRIIPILLCLLLMTGCANNKTVIQGFSMDASYRIEAEYISKEEESAIKGYLNRIDSVFNAYQGNSLISKLNQTKVLTASTEEEQILFDCIQQTLPFCNEYFDISIRAVSKLWDFKSDSPVLPDNNLLSEGLTTVDYRNIEIAGNTILLKNGAEIEGGAVVKGYICDNMAKMLSGENALIDIGGTVKTIGKDRVVGVKSPDYNGLLCSFTLSDGKSVSTSGSYERNFVLDNQLYHHILDPKTGYPTDTNFISVTVICNSALQADILSTTLFAQNSFKIPESAEVIFVTKDNMVYVSDGIENFKLLNISYQKAELTEE